MNKKEPLFHMTKRASISTGKNIMIHVLAVIVALIICALVIVALTHQNPLQVYGGIINGAVGNPRRSWITIRGTVLLLLVAVGLTPAFVMRFWNIGAEGQILIGGTASAAVMIYMGGKYPTWLLVIIMIISSIVAGLIWGLIPAFFKARYNTNETLFTLMMNYVAIQIVNICVCFWENPSGSNSVGIINQKTRSGWFPSIAGNEYILNVIIVLAITVAMYFYQHYSKQGYEIAVVGSSQNTARYAGINVKKVILRTMMISGAICGLTGSLIVGGVDHTISVDTAGGRGFTAIIVAWMAQFNPFVMILISFLLVFMQQGAIQIATQFKLNKNASDIITGIILFCLIGCEFFVRYKLEFRHKESSKEA